jgi:hypothetical protein
MGLATITKGKKYFPIYFSLFLCTYKLCSISGPPIRKENVAVSSLGEVTYFHKGSVDHFGSLWPQKQDHFGK